MLRTEFPVALLSALGTGDCATVTLLPREPEERKRVCWPSCLYGWAGSDSRKAGRRLGSRVLCFRPSELGNLQSEQCADLTMWLGSSSRDAGEQALLVICGKQDS